eukprot:7814164-Alexandrium_andersonii.AAC.1
MSASSSLFAAASSVPAGWELHSLGGHRRARAGSIRAATVGRCIAAGLARARAVAHHLRRW